MLGVPGCTHLWLAGAGDCVAGCWHRWYFKCECRPPAVVWVEDHELDPPLTPWSDPEHDVYQDIVDYKKKMSG